MKQRQEHTQAGRRAGGRDMWAGVHVGGRAAPRVASRSHRLPAPAPNPHLRLHQSLRIMMAREARAAGRPSALVNVATTCGQGQGRQGDVKGCLGTSHALGCERYWQVRGRGRGLPGPCPKEVKGTRAPPSVTPAPDLAGCCAAPPAPPTHPPPALEPGTCGGWADIGRARGRACIGMCKAGQREVRGTQAALGGRAGTARTACLLRLPRAPPAALLVAHLASLGSGAGGRPSPRAGSSAGANSASPSKSDWLKSSARGREKVS